MEPKAPHVRDKKRQVQVAAASQSDIHTVTAVSQWWTTSLSCYDPLCHVVWAQVGDNNHPSVQMSFNGMRWLWSHHLGLWSVLLATGVSLCVAADGSFQLQLQNNSLTEKRKRKQGGGPKRPGASAGNLPVAPRLGLIFHLNAIYGCTPRVDAWLPHALRGGRGRLLPKEPSEVLEAFFRGHELGTPFVSCVPEVAQSWRRHRALSRVLPYLPLEPHCSTKQALPIQGPGLAGPLIGLR